MSRLKIVVLSSLFPSSVRKQSGLFVRERMFRVGRFADIEVVSPVPWFPGQSIIRWFKPNYRPMPALKEVQHGITVHFPRFLAIPGLFRQWDGAMMARAAKRTIVQIDKEQGVDIIDSHFTYPDGLAATEIAKSLAKKVTITLRGTELSHSLDPLKKPLLLAAWEQADHMICVSQSLKDLAISIGAQQDKFTVVGNGVDTDKFTVIEQKLARQKLAIDTDSNVMITVGGLVKRKGFHRVIACMPELLKTYPKLVYLIVGGASAEGNIEQELKQQCKELGVEKHVRFLGSLPPEQLSVPLSAADIFVLATANEGWANVILESMACGTPVIATDVGGNKEVVNSDSVGEIVPFDDHHALLTAINSGLSKNWDRTAIIEYANNNHWDTRMTKLNTLFQSLVKDTEQ
ncbi:glycosyltransferase [Aliiglaciecola litoralis]|uniref:Glycosyltransferase family 4 protein n=1 Tax=Aliiglaciecola litoralis TaxID=582857 RepID=A0ABN1LJP5_9ALTE